MKYAMPHTHPLMSLRASGSQQGRAFVGDDRSSGLLTLAFSLKWILEEGEERSGFGVGDGEQPEGER